MISELAQRAGLDCSKVINHKKRFVRGFINIYNIFQRIKEWNISFYKVRGFFVYSNELKRITGAMQKFCSVWDLPAPAASNQIEQFAKEVWMVLKCVLPEDYIVFLHECNGLEFDGSIIYGTDNFLENQADYGCISKQYLILAEYDIGWFCMKKSDSSFWELDKPSGREIQQFLCAGDMIKSILFWAANRADG